MKTKNYQTGFLRPITTALLEEIEEQIPEIKDPACIYCFNKTEPGDFLIVFKNQLDGGECMFVCLQCFLNTQLEDVIRVQVRH